jgi:peptide/nickel transport system substrate-binding protein
MLSTFTAQNVTVKANPHYWQANEPKIGTVQYQAFDSQSGVLAALETGGISWASLKMAAGVKPFTSRDPSHNKVVEERGAINVLLPNVSQYPLSLLPVRQAISDALNRTQISAVGENGVNPPAASPVGLDPGSQQSFIAPAYRSLRYKPNGDVAQARQVLTAAGFKAGAGGMFLTPKGTPLSLQILAPSGSAAFIRVAGLIKQELQPAGIGIDITTEAQSAVTAQTEQGHFQLVFFPANIDSVAQPYFFYQSIMDHADSAPVGSATSIDEGRFDNAAADADLHTFEVSTPGSAAQRQALYGLEQIFMKDVPAIPDFETVYRAEYSTSQFTGWPSQQSMYVSPEGYDNSAEDVLLHLTAAK